jgi:hypothetical protein
VRPLTNNPRTDLLYRDNGHEDQHRSTPPSHRPRNGHRDGRLVQPIRQHRTWPHQEYQHVSQELLEKASSISIPSTHHLRAVRPSEMTKCKTREAAASFSRAKGYRLGNCPQRVETTFWSLHQTRNKLSAEIFGQRNRATYRQNIWCVHPARVEMLLEYPHRGGNFSSQNPNHKSSKFYVPGLNLCVYNMCFTSR